MTPKKATKPEDDEPTGPVGATGPTGVTGSTLPAPDPPASDDVTPGQEAKGRSMCPNCGYWH